MIQDVEVIDRSRINYGMTIGDWAIDD